MTAEEAQNTTPGAGSPPRPAEPQAPRQPREGGGGPPRRDGGGPPRRDARGDHGRGGDQQRPQRRRFVRRFHRRKICRFCVAKTEYIDYKDARRLRRFTSDRGKILPRRVTGCCARHQRMLTSAVKRARNIALLPFKAD